MFFDLQSLVVLAYDLVVIPYLLAWSIEMTGNWLILSWVTVSFWTMDICLSCLTGIVQEGKVIKDPVIIVKNYMASWMVPDLAIVLSDWFAMLMTVALDNSSNGGIKMLRVMKFGRLLRVMGMFKVFRFARVVEEFLDRSIGETYRMTMRIVSIVASIIWINHIMCCGWFAIGRSGPSDTGTRWVESDFLEQNEWYQYWTTFHWSITQITLGATEVISSNTVERMYTVCCLVFGLLFGSTLVSSLSATMVEFQMLRNGRQQKLRLLRQFLSDHTVDLDISYLVQKQVKERLGPTDKLHESDVDGLNLLSAQLLSMLRREIYAPHLVTHPLFNLWSGLDPNLFNKLCFTMHFRYLRQEDDLFVPGPAEAIAYYLSSGSLSYTQEPASSRVTEVFTADVKVGAWLAEAALWCYWIHVGTAEASATSELLMINEDALNSAVNVRHTIRKVVQQYGEVFCKRLKKSAPPDGSFPSDLEGPSYEDIVTAMEKELQIEIGTDAMKRFARKLWDSPASQKLKEEVLKGKSTVMISASGEIHRVVLVVAVRVENSFGQILTQVGVYDKEKQAIVKEVQLPGQKQERSQDAVESAVQCLKQKTGTLADHVEIVSTAREVEYKQSKEYGVRTKYIRTVCRAVVKKSFDLGQWQQDNNLSAFRTVTFANSVSPIASPSLRSVGAGGNDFIRAVQHPIRLPGDADATNTSFAGEDMSWDVYVHMGSSKVFFYSWINEDELPMWLQNGEAMVKRRLDGFNYEEYAASVANKKTEAAQLPPVNSEGFLETVVSVTPSMGRDGSVLVSPRNESEPSPKPADKVYKNVFDLDNVWEVRV